VKVLLVHPGFDFSVSDVFVGWREGLTQAGAAVRPYDLSQRLTFYASAQFDGEPALTHEQAVTLAAEGILSTAWRAQPDVVVIVTGMFVPTSVLDALRAGGTRVVLIHTESPYEDDAQLERAVHADLNVLNDPTNVDVFAEHCRAYYQPHAWRPGFHDVGQPDEQLRADVTFVGTGFPSRIALLEQIDWSGIELNLAGQWGGLDDQSPLRKHLVHDIDECCPQELTARLYASAGMSMNLYRREANRPELVDGWAMGPREVELAAAGVFFAREPRPEGDALFPMLPTFTGADELADIVRWSIAHPGPRAEAAAQARAAVADRTFHRSATRLLSELQKEMS